MLLTLRILTILNLIFWLLPYTAAAEELKLASYLSKSPARIAVKAQASGKVRVDSFVVVHKDRILLKDIAHIEGFTKDKRDKIGSLFLAKAPHPGEQRSFTAQYLRELFNAGKTGGKWEIPNTVTVKRGSTTISKESLRKMFKAAVVRHTKLPESMVEVPSINLDHDLLIPSGENSIHLSFTPGERFRGRATAKVDVVVNKQRYRQYYISGEVKLYGSSVVVARKVERGKKIKPEDLRIENTVISEAPPHIVTEIADAVGMEAVVDLQPGSLLRENMLKAPIIVNRGDLVNIVLEMPNLRVETKGIAKQRGARKQVIKVLNINSRKIVYGRVVNDNEVRVKF